MLKEKLVKALKEAGLNEGLADVINVTSEDQIKGVITKLQSTESESDQLDYSLIIKSKGFKDFVDNKGGFKKVIEESPVLKSGHDKTVTDAVSTNRKKLLKELASDGDSQEEGQTEQEESDNTPSWAKTLIEKVNNLENKSQETTQLEQVQAIIKKSKLPETLQQKWITRVDLNSDNSFEDQVKTLETEYNELHQSIVGDTAGSGLPVGGQAIGKATDQEVESLVDDLL